MSIGLTLPMQPPGFAFVRFDNSDAAHRAVKACQEIGGILIAGKAVRVEMAGDKERKHYKGSAKQQEVNKNDIVKTTLQYAIKCNQYGVRSEFECSYSSDSSQKGSERQLRNKELRSDNIKQHRTRLESQSGCQKIEGQARNMSRPKMRADYRRRKFARPRSRNPFRSRSRSRSRGRR